jgi:signal transduction histidine kinase
VTDVGELPVSSDLERRTVWFIKLRWLAAAGVIGTAVAVRSLGVARVPLGPILALAGSLLVYNAILFFVEGRLRAEPGKGDWGSTHPFARLLAPRTFRGLGDEGRVARAALFAFVQITVDFLFLAVLLHLCGGVESPFALFFVFHVVIASILLSRRATYVQTTIGFLFYAAVVWGEYFGILDHYPLHWIWPPDAYRTWSVAAASLVVLGATLYLASYLCSTIAVDLRERVRANVCLSRQIAGDKRQLEIAYEKLRESERTKSQYMRKVAHELRGPLGTIETALKVLLQGMAGSLSEPSRELIGRAQRRAGELAAITHDLLLLARAREALVEQTRAPVAVDGLVAEVIEDSREPAGRKGVSLAAAAPSGGIVLGDPVALRQLVANLVENGIRYTKPGGSVTVSLHCNGERLALVVEDTGIGIAAEDLPNIFDEFYRGAQAREYAEQGTGLGLAIVKEIAERHGGNVAVESQLGQGTRVTVTLHAGNGSRELGMEAERT